MNTIVTAQTPSDRPKRRKSHQLARYRLSVPHGIEGYYIRWCNDDGKELQWRLQSDYEFVAAEEVGLTSENQDDTKVKRIVGTRENGEPLWAYLLKIRQDWRDEDVKEESQLQASFEKQVKGGQIAVAGNDNRYVPKGGIAINNSSERRSKTHG